MQGYNAEDVITVDQLVIVAELRNSSVAFGQIAPASTR
jgi:hypothetical protein